MESFGRRLRRHRLHNRHTKRSLSKASGISARSIRYWEQNEHCPSLDNAIKIARFLDFSLDHLKEYPEMAHMEHTCINCDFTTINSNPDYPNICPDCGGTEFVRITDEQLETISPQGENRQETSNND